MAKPMNNTGNAVDSSDPRDLEDNARILDRMLNSSESSVSDRLNAPIKTWFAIQDGFDKIVSSLDSAGVITVPDVASGLSATTNGQYFRVILGSGNKIAFSFYRNINGQAVNITSQVSDKYYDALSSELAETQSLSEGNNKKILSLFDSGFTRLDSEINTTGETVLSKQSLMKVISLTNTATVSTGIKSTLSVMQGDAELWSALLLPGETISQTGRSSPYIRHTVKDRQVTSVVFDTATAFVRFQARFTSPDFLYAATGNYNIYDRTGAFASVTQVQAGTVTQRSVSSYVTTANPGFQLAIPASEIAAAGYDATSVAGVTAYVDDRYGDLVFWCRSATIATIPETAMALTEAGTVTIVATSDPVFDIGFYTAPDADEKQVISDTGFEKYSATVKNNLPVSLGNAVSHIRAAFLPGKAPSDANLLLEDADGNAVPCQWLPDREVNFATGRGMGYHSDNSLRAGSVVFMHDFSASSEDRYILKVSNNTRSNQTGPELVSVVGGCEITVGEYTFFFSSATGYQLASFLESGVSKMLQYGAYLADQASTVSGYDKPMQSGFKSISITAWGDIFTEVTTVLEYKSVRATVITRLYRSGRVTVDTTFLTLADIPENTLWGLTGRMETYSPGFTASSNLMCVFWPDGGKNRSSQLTFCHGHLHRDDPKYEATLPVWTFVTTPATDRYRLYGGWMNRSATIPVAAIAKNTAFAHQFVVELSQQQTSLQAANDATHNLPTGFAGTGIIESMARRKLSSDTLEYVYARSLYWDDFFDANDISRDQNTYATHLCLLKYGVSRKFTFDQIYANFKSYIDTKFGGAANLGNAYNNNVLILQFASRATLPNILWLYKAAVEAGDTAKQAEMKASAYSLAVAMRDSYNSRGFVTLIANQTTANSNSNATALRALAIAIHLGTDADGSFAAALTGLENVLKTNYALNANILTENVNGSLSANQYLHYSMYAFHDYFRACVMLKRPLAIDMTTYIMTALSGYGALREQEFCISNSRKGSSLTYAYYISTLNTLGGLSGQNACRAVLNHLLEQMNPDNSMPRPMDDWPANLNTGAASPVPFELQALSEMLLQNYFS